MSKYWMVTNRQESGDGWGADEGKLRFWVSEASAAELASKANWVRKSRVQFARALQRAADEFPDMVDPEENGREKHVALFVHGYNNSVEDALRRYTQITDSLFVENDLGICVLFTWPSDGLRIGYYPDRKDARASADELAEVLSLLYDYLLARQRLAMTKGVKTCRAKTSIIAHSMGSYVVQKAMSVLWTRTNQPLLVSLVNQFIMVAADVDNDLFKSGESVDGSDGDAIANLCYRITALYSGLDATLGLSSGFKHFGKRRLGRSGLDRNKPVPDNVWDLDCSTYISEHENKHSSYFEVAETREIMASLLRGVDRGVLKRSLSVG